MNFQSSIQALHAQSSSINLEAPVVTSRGLGLGVEDSGTELLNPGLSKNIHEGRRCPAPQAMHLLVEVVVRLVVKSQPASSGFGLQGDGAFFFAFKAL